jgi:predicted RNA-binding Zn-ribbon protein involved in translation (DUF1610 family)
MSKEYNTKYYEANKKRILKSMLEKVLCPDCNKMITRCNMNKHQRSQKHKANMEKERNDEITTMQNRITELEKRLVIQN